MCHIDEMVRREQIMVKINCNHNYVAVVFVIFILGVYADEHTHTYVDGEEVVLWMNSVGPYYDRQETYAYFSLPFCAGPGETVSHYRKSLVEALQGVDIEFSGLGIVFKEDVISTPYCEILLTKEKQKALIHAVKNHYWYQMYLDDIPVWGFVGELTETENGTSYHLWTHKKFEIGYSGNQIVDVNFTSENKVNLVEVERILFTYEVIWKNSSIKFEDRVDKYSDPYYLQLRMRWFSIISIFIMLILLVGLGSMILMRKLLEDYARCSKGQPKISTIFATSSPSKIQHVRLI